MKTPYALEFSCGKGFDLNCIGFLPLDWQQEIKKVVRQFAKTVEMRGDSSMSLPHLNEAPTTIAVVTGDVIKKQLPWLHELYTEKLLPLVSAVAGRQLRASERLESGVNLNVLSGMGASYEWHLDSNPLTGLLFVTSHNSEKGGALVFRNDDGDEKIYPRSGLFLAFDARENPHAVLPIRTDEIRISIPMNYYYIDEDEVRPDDLDTYMYGDS